MRASHILIKHNKSRNPSSHKESVITRSKSEAREILEEIRNEILDKKETFEEMALKNSDCSSYKRDGDLGFFSRGKMQKPFSDAAFKLEIGEMSDIVETESGLHLIKRLN